MTLTARAIADIEKRHRDGLSSRQILDMFEDHGAPLSEATLRKYVQLGLLPRSRRVGEKGKHRGSRGIYPVEVIRRVDEIRRAMDNGETLERLASTQAVRTQLGALRSMVDALFAAAKEDLETRQLDKKAKRTLRAELADLKKDSKAWVKDMDRWSVDVARQEAAAESAAKRSRRKGD